MAPEEINRRCDDNGIGMNDLLKQGFHVIFLGAWLIHDAPVACKALFNCQRRHPDQFQFAVFSYRKSNFLDEHLTVSKFAGRTYQAKNQFPLSHFAFRVRTPMLFFFHCAPSIMGLYYHYPDSG